jgi:hypothetical protein
MKNNQQFQDAVAEALSHAETIKEIAGEIEAGLGGNVFGIRKALDALEVEIKLAKNNNAPIPEGHFVCQACGDLKTEDDFHAAFEYEGERLAICTGCNGKSR